MKHRIVARVPAQLFKHPRIVVPAAPVVELHHPAHPLVLRRHKAQESGLEGCQLLPGDRLSPQALLEDSLQLLLRGGLAHRHSQGVVAGTAAHLVKEGHAPLEGLLQIREGFDLHPRGPAQTPQIVPILRALQSHSAVGPPGGKNLDGEILFLRQLLVPLQGIGGVVGGTHQGDAGAGNQISGTHLRLLKLFVAQIPHLLGGVPVQNALIPKVAAQLQMAPMVQRVSNGHLQSLRPLLEFLPVRGIPGDAGLVHAVGAHQPPLVVVTAQPHLGDVFKVPVLGDLLGVQVTVIVQNRHFLRHTIEPLGGGSGQQKNVVEKRFHLQQPPKLKSDAWLHYSGAHLASQRQEPYFPDPG